MTTAEQGMVFLHDATGFPCGPTLMQVCHNVEIAPGGWYGTDSDPSLPWSINPYDGIQVPALNGVDATRTSIGEGLATTLAIIQQNGPYDRSSNSYAAGAANAYRGGGFSDWYLPNPDEAAKFTDVWLSLIQMGYDASYEYWNSHECGSTAAYKIARDGSGTFYTGGCDSKSSPHPVRPIRAF